MVAGVNSLDDWSQRWREKNTGWHLSDVNPILAQHFDKVVNGRSNLKIFVPLCGKTKDFKWMFQQGHRVVGVEFDELTVRELFQESDVKIATEQIMGDLKLFASHDQRFKVYVGDFFAFKLDFEKELCDAVWDRGSLVAVNVADREKYVAIMKSIMSSSCRYLLDTLEYDLAEYIGTPHSVSEAEIVTLYNDCEVTFLSKLDALNERWRSNGLTRFEEKAHLITKKTK